jgi:hypothetical protein
LRDGWNAFRRFGPCWIATLFLDPVVAWDRRLDPLFLRRCDHPPESAGAVAFTRNGVHRARQDRDYRYKERLKGRDHEAIST